MNKRKEIRCLDQWFHVVPDKIKNTVKAMFWDARWGEFADDADARLFVAHIYESYKINISIECAKELSAHHSPIRNKHNY